MTEKSIFVSVGGTANPRQETFVCAVEARLRSEGLIPCTVGRNTFSADAPLKGVVDLMHRCSGVVIIALERTYFPTGVERRGGNEETALSETKIATPWNQIEAAMAYMRGLPVLVLVEDGVRAEGLLAQSNEWYVQKVAVDAAALSTPLFNGVLASWKQKIATATVTGGRSVDPEKLTVAQLLGLLKPAHLRASIATLAAVIGAAFAVGAQLFERPAESVALASNVPSVDSKDGGPSPTLPASPNISQHGDLRRAAEAAEVNARKMHKFADKQKCSETRPEIYNHAVLARENAARDFAAGDFITAYNGFKEAVKYYEQCGEDVAG